MKLSHALAIMALCGFVAPAAMAKSYSKRPRAQKEHALKSVRRAKVPRTKAEKPSVEARKRHASETSEG